MTTSLKNIQQSVEEKFKSVWRKKLGCHPNDELHEPCGNHSKDIKHFLVQLSSKDLPTRFGAVFALARMGDAISPMLHAVLECDTWDQTQLGVIEVLKRMEDPRSVPVLRRVLQRSDDRERLAVFRGLRWVGKDPECFLDGLEDSSWEVRREAVFALCDLRMPKLRFLIACMTNDPHQLVRGAAVNALGIIGSSDDVEFKQLVSNALDDPSEWVRAMAVWMVGRFGIRGFERQVARTVARGGESVVVQAKRTFPKMF